MVDGSDPSRPWDPSGRSLRFNLIDSMRPSFIVGVGIGMQLLVLELGWLGSALAALMANHCVIFNFCYAETAKGKIKIPF